MIFPEVGSRVKCIILKSSFVQLSVKIVEIESKPLYIEYKGIAKWDLTSGTYACEKYKLGETVEGLVTSCSEGTIHVQI